MCRKPHVGHVQYSAVAEVGDTCPDAAKQRIHFISTLCLLANEGEQAAFNILRDVFGEIRPSGQKRPIFEGGAEFRFRQIDPANECSLSRDVRGTIGVLSGGGIV